MSEAEVEVKREPVSQVPAAAAVDGDGGLEELLDARNVEKFLEDLASLAARSVAPAVSDVSCGITIQHGEQQMSAAWSDARAAELDEIQYELDRGPCLHSLRTRTVVKIDDMVNDVDWPAWQERAMAAGVGSSLAVPVPIDTGARAALNFYSSLPHAFDDAAVEMANEMARRAVRAIGLVSWLVEQERHSEQLRAAVGSRSVIDQALGIIMAQNRCDADEAFQIVRKASHNRNVKLRQVAVEIVTSATGKPPVTPPRFR